VQLPADFERAIDQRLRAGDPLASADLAEACFQPLVRWLRRAFPGVDDPAFYDDAATESILNYAERPAIFDPARNSLSGFLRMSAAADLRNCLSRQRRVRNHEVPVETEGDDGNTTNEEPFRRFEWNEEEELLIRQIDGARLVEDLLAEVPTEDRDAVRLLLSGEREPEDYVAALQLHDLTPGEQKLAIKRFKDRWMKKLDRWAKEHGGRRPV
jgi:DNA-directed RNA polymerase specialized sigma24 family protein